MENTLEQLATVVTGPSGLQRRVALLERGIDANGTNRAENRSRVPVGTATCIKRYTELAVFATRTRDVFFSRHIPTDCSGASLNGKNCIFRREMENKARTGLIIRSGKSLFLLHSVT